MIDVFLVGSIVIVASLIAFMCGWATNSVMAALYDRWPDQIDAIFGWFGL